MVYLLAAPKELWTFRIQVLHWYQSIKRANLGKAWSAKQHAQYCGVDCHTIDMGCLQKFVDHILGRLWQWITKFIEFHILDLLKSIIVIGEKLVPSTLANVTITSVDELIKKSMKGNGYTYSLE